MLPAGGHTPCNTLTIELPTQIPIVSSILFFIAIQTDVTCSAAFAYMNAAYFS